MLSRVLVSLDGSELSELALPYAQKVTDKSGEIVLLSVVDLPDFPIYTVYPIPVATPEPDYSSIVNDLLANARDYLENIANQLRLAGYRVKTVVTCGEAATSILEEAVDREVDAIIMSTHGRSGFSKWLFGSVTQKVLNAMPCPVIVVPGKQHILNKQQKADEAVQA